MASFTAFTMMGLFPNPGQNVYLIIPPFFKSVSFETPVTGNSTGSGNTGYEDGKTTWKVKSTIKNIGWNGTSEGMYIQSANLNGVNYTKNWIGHEFFVKGWTLELVLGVNESAWGTGVEDLPPSMSSGMGSMEV